MSRVNYTKHFGDKTQGPLQHTLLLSLVEKPLLDPPLSEQDREQSLLVTSMAKKNTPMVCGFLGNSEFNKGLLLANIAYQTKNKVLLVTQELFNNLFTSDLAKLIAQTQQQNAIIYFDLADDLINDNIDYADTDEPINLDLLFSVIEKYQGLVIFSLTQIESAERLKARHISVLTTH
ncbi:hypothetical protein [Aliiglaciecola sp. NS0011-25]|uniref:hypothetical protein n=1 Tax=Aliiglaciecola sp. NS0011-25 TaxID=3127654 RepID=UPI0031056331